MSEQSAGTPPPASQPSGIEQQPGQPPPNTPAADAAAPNQPANPQAPPAAPPVTPEEFARLRAENERLQQGVRHFQSNYDRAQQQLRAMAGVAPTPPDPYAAKIKAFVDKGYGEEDARMLVDLVRSETEPLRQRNAQLEATVQGSSRVSTVFQQAMSQDADLFADPRIQQCVYNHLNALAQQGQLDYLTPDFAIEVGNGEWAKLNRNKTGQPPPAAPVARPMFGPMSFTGPQGGGYVPLPSSKPGISPEGAAYDREIQARFNIKP